MTMKVLGYAATSAKVPLAPFEFTRRAPRPDDVVMEVLYCGVCHSDLHQARNDWGFSTYPIVPGHEVVGRVTAVGKDVTKFKVGDFAGIGCMVDSCRHCQPCQQGLSSIAKKGMYRPTMVLTVMTIPQPMVAIHKLLLHHKISC